GPRATPHRTAGAGPDSCSTSSGGLRPGAFLQELDQRPHGGGDGLVVAGEAGGRVAVLDDDLVFLEVAGALGMDPLRARDAALADESLQLLGRLVGLGPGVDRATLGQPEIAPRLGEPDLHRTLPTRSPSPPLLSTIGRWA